MSKADQHARDLAKYTYYDKSLTQFSSLTENDLETFAKWVVPSFGGIFSGNVEFAGAANVTNGFFTIDTRLVVNGLTFISGTSLEVSAPVTTFTHPSSIVTFISSDVNFNSETTVDINGIIDFTGSTIVGFPDQSGDTYGTTATGGWVKSGVTGLIREWGRSSSVGPNGNIVITTTNTFTDTNYSIVANLSTTNSIEQPVTTKTLTTTTFNLRASHDSSSYPIQWEVTGF